MQTYSDLHKAARHYAELGIPVFPVEVNGKKPATVNGFYDATTDLEQIDAWWSKSDYNIAFSPGQIGLFVIDIDPGSVLPQDLPSTYTVRTPRGGFHYYFEGNGATTASKLAEHIDTRGEGGYVLAPPSIVNGNPYYVEKALSYAAIPDWVNEKLTKKDVEIASNVDDLDLPINITRAKERLIKYVRDGNIAIQGHGGDAHTYGLCCEVLDLGLSPDAALTLIEEVWNPHCQPPWETSELALKLHNAANYRQNEIGAYAVEPPQDVFGATISKLFPVKQSRFYFKDEEEIENEPDPQWIIKDLITERSTVLLFGPTQSYKSFLTLDIALSVSTGTQTFGTNPLNGLVFYSALEGKAHLKKARRSWKIARGFEGKLSNFYVGTAPMVGLPNEVQEFGDQIKERCGSRVPRLIIIDTLGKAMAGLNENDALDAGKFIRFCDSLVEHFQCTVIAIHHTGKDQARGARGSSAFHAGFDTVIEVKAKRTTKAVEVRVIKHKDAEERETPWTFEGRLIGGSLAFFPTNDKEHFELTNEQAMFSPKKIGGALKTLGAYGQGKAVSVNVLAMQITARLETQTEEEYQVALSRTIRALNKGAKDFLEPYTLKTGKQTLWALPESTD